MKMCKGDHRDDDYFTYKCLLYCQLWRHKAALQKMTLTLKTTFDFYHVLLSSTSIPIMCHCIKKKKKNCKEVQECWLLAFFSLSFSTPEFTP